MSNHANKIIIAGGTGYIGQTLIKYFKDHELVILTRKPIASDNRNVKYVQWNGRNLGEWAREFEGAKAVINMAGRTVNCRYTEKNKAEIFASRLDSTAVIGKAIQQCTNPPGVWINAGSATIYRHSADKAMTEAGGEFHNDFSVQVCKAWEKTFDEVTVPNTRKVFLRIAITLGNGGGVFQTLRKLTKLGLGGKHGNGQQYVSWIHETDLCRIIEYVMENNDMQGIYNAAAPVPERNIDFMRMLRKKSGAWFGLPQPKWMLGIGTWIMGTEKELVLKSRNVVPERLLQRQFVFRFNTVGEAMDDLLKK